MSLFTFSLNRRKNSLRTTTITVLKNLMYIKLNTQMMNDNFYDLMSESD